MFLEGLDHLDQQIIQMLIENARASVPAKRPTIRVSATL